MRFDQLPPRGTGAVVRSEQLVEDFAFRGHARWKRSSIAVVVEGIERVFDVPAPVPPWGLRRGWGRPAASTRRSMHERGPARYSGTLAV